MPDQDDYRAGREIDRQIQVEMEAKATLERIREIIKNGIYPERTLERIKEILN